MTPTAKQNDAVEALLRQTICTDLSLSPDLGHIWAGLYERIAGPCASDVSATRAAARAAARVARKQRR